MGDYGIKISVAGKDITSTEPRDYVFNSAYSSVKIALQGSGTIEVPADSSGVGTTASVNIPHGLSFVPLALFFSELKPGSGNYYSQATQVASLSELPETDIDTDADSASIDATNLTLTFRNFNTTTARTISYKYIIFGDSGN